MVRLYLYGAGLVIAILSALGLVSWGKHLVRVEWERDRAVQEAILRAERMHNERIVRELEERHAKDIAISTSEAGRAAVRDWIRTHGVLQAPACPEQTSDSAGIPDDTSREQRPSGGAESKERLEQFIIDCALDAQRLTDWQDLCRAQGCEIR